MPVVSVRRLVVFAINLTAALAACAEEGDGLKIIGSVAVMHDSNLFRLSSTANPQALVGRSSAAETVRSTTLGFNYTKAYSLQSVELDLSMVNYSYQNFSYLSFSALNYRAAWHWSYTPHLYGNLITSRQQTLNSFSDSRGYTLRNERIDTQRRIDAVYEVDARWRVLASLAQLSQDNQQPLLEESGYRQTTADAGLRYVFPSTSYASLTSKATDGSYLDRPLSAVSLFDNRFTQNDSEVNVFWALSSKTTADFKVGYRSRKHPSFPQRNFDGATGSARLNWEISGKSALSAGWARDLAAYQTTSSSFVQTDRFFVGPVWQMGNKTTARLQLGSSVRDYRGPPGLGAAAQRRDVNRDVVLSFGWEPRSFVALNASLQNARRSSNLPGLDFNSNTLNVSARLTF